MVRGIYTGASGMISQQARMDVVANNLANVDKTAYKSDTTVFKAFPDMIIRRVNDDGVGIVPAGSYDSMPYVGKLSTGLEVNEVFTQFEQGPLTRTENNFDIALEGDGFFAVLTERGIRYTRNGSLTINDEGVLMTHNGDPVLGQNGIIKIQKHNFMINEDGSIYINQELADQEVVGDTENTWQEPVLLDTLKLADFEYKRHLKKEGNSTYRETDESGPPLPVSNLKIRQGFLEKSNVNVVRGMVDMIEVQRSYEANQKAVTTSDSTLGKLINEMGR